VLGPLAENRLFLSSDNYGLGWTARPGVLLIFALTLLGIFYPIFKSRKEEKEKAPSQVATGAMVEEVRQSGVRFSAAALFALAIVILLALALWQSRNFGFRAGLFPWVIGTPTLILAIAQLGKDLLGKKGKQTEVVGETAEGEVPPALARQRTINILLWTLFFFVAIWFLGFSYAVPIAMLLYLKLAGKEKWPMALAVTFFTWLFFYALFERALSVPFPDGLLFTLFKGQ
jgi:hypothetical protein